MRCRAWTLRHCEVPSRSARLRLHEGWRCKLKSLLPASFRFMKLNSFRTATQLWRYHSNQVTTTSDACCTLTSICFAIRHHSSGRRQAWSRPRVHWTKFLVSDEEKLSVWLTSRIRRNIPTYRTKRDRNNFLTTANVRGFFLLKWISIRLISMLLCELVWPASSGKLSNSWNFNENSNLY